MQDEERGFPLALFLALLPFFRLFLLSASLADCTFLLQSFLPNFFCPTNRQTQNPSIDPRMHIESVVALSMPILKELSKKPSFAVLP